MIEEESKTIADRVTQLELDRERDSQLTAKQIEGTRVILRMSKKKSYETYK